MAAVTKEYVDSEIKNLESRTDAKFERLIGEVNTGFEKLRGEMIQHRADVKDQLTAMDKKIDGMKLWVLTILAAQFGLIMTGMGLLLNYFQ